ncbi:MAG: hypothetical protein KFB96_11585 [Thiocapsa sp.]|uniref:hypothetical protein n=1 Tax=Thiocapsa sp. TaxID=2024551 RepID=UPI001BCD03E7|nr:hypothetical protein [Thiocapsa sp.]QVL50983.1 MAG: hypothetical protein KFB96_11585 [Thiocapsa sp.]
MSRLAHYLTISTALCLLASPLPAQPLTADDFLPPVQAETVEQKQALTQVQGPVQEVQDAATGSTVVQAETAQDAINTVANRRAPGAEMVRFGSGIGWVATGMGGYELMENPTATRIAKRDAYVRAFMDAKRHLAESLTGLSSTGRMQVLEQMESVTSAKADLTNYASTQEEQLEQSVQMLLRGFVVYSVEDNTDARTVYVTLVTTPKTRGQLNRPTPTGLEAATMQDGLNKVLVEIQNGLVPPVGGRLIQVPATGEIAFVGFGSDVVRTSDNAMLQAKQRLNAEKIAQMRAADALIGMLIGDETSWKGKLDNSTQKLIAQFERDDSAGADPSAQRFDQKRESFLNVQRSTEQYQSIRSGILPPGVVRKSFASADNGEVYAVAVYVPSASDAAAQAAKEMSEARLIKTPTAGGNGGAPASGFGSTAPTLEDVPRPSAEVGPGPTGQISDDRNL